jgi:hypothetical protein
MLAAYLERTGWTKMSSWHKRSTVSETAYFDDWKLRNDWIEAPRDVYGDHVLRVSEAIRALAAMEQREPWQVLRSVLGKPSVEELEAENERLRTGGKALLEHVSCWRGSSDCGPPLWDVDGEWLCKRCYEQYLDRDDNECVKLPWAAIVEEP